MRELTEQEKHDWLARAARAASEDAGGVSTALLGDYLNLLSAAATHGRRPRRTDLEAVGLLGRQAAEQGVAVGQAVSLYLAAAREVWTGLPQVVRTRDKAALRAATDALLHVVDVAVAAFAEGHAAAARELVRRETSVRRELVEDLLRGDAHLGELVERAEPFGIDLTRPHQVALASPDRRLSQMDATTGAVERLVVEHFGDRDVLVAAKDSLVVVLAPPRRATGRRRQETADDLGPLVLAELDRLRTGSPWRVAVGREHHGAYGIARSYEEAREALKWASRLRLEARVTDAADVLVYRVVMRDQPAIVDLVETVLGPLTGLRGGAQPFVDTLEAYFATGGVATRTAARLHLSVRAVTYRLARIEAATGHDPNLPAHRLALQVAVVGAKVLGWPGRDLPRRRPYRGVGDARGLPIAGPLATHRGE